MDRQGAALIEEHVRHILAMVGFAEVTVHCALPEEHLIRVEIEAGDEGRLLIGAHGAHLSALQHVLRCLLRKNLKNEEVRILVDVNGYRLRRERTLLEMAQEVARRAHRTGRTVVLEPMTAADRRAIHTALATHKDIRTESLGEEPNRRVVVRPVFL
ncbi:MAG: hypothetical protein HYR90_04975 [Candidatus Andersenbacteria bacterium]|nr:hypothetical protein [Candidatus Andersenbacteria bacterium]MBI3250758.1 hypothetical protein [Candidatus Andersenbacteria bacterium]